MVAMRLLSKIGATVSVRQAARRCSSKESTRGPESLPRGGETRRLLEGGFHEGLAYLRGPPGVDQHTALVRQKQLQTRGGGCVSCGIGYHVGRRPLDRRGSGRLSGVSGGPGRDDRS